MDKTDKVIAELFDWVDDRFLVGAFDEVDKLLEGIKIKQTQTTYLIALLTITYAAKDKLKNREKLVGDVEAELKTRKDDADRVDSLLGGLR